MGGTKPMWNMLKTDRATDVGGADVYIGIISGSISGNVLVSNESDVINMLIMQLTRYTEIYSR